MKSTPRKLLSSALSINGKDLAILLIRLFVGFMMLRHGIEKIAAFSALSTTFPNPIGLGSKLSLILIISAEVGASILIILGLLTRPAALIEMFGMSVAAFFTYSPLSFATSELPLMYLAIFTLLFISGGGRYSIDEILRRDMLMRI